MLQAEMIANDTIDRSIDRKIKFSLLFQLLIKKYSALSCENNLFLSFFGSSYNFFEKKIHLVIKKNFYIWFSYLAFFIIWAISRTYLFILRIWFHKFNNNWHIISFSLSSFFSLESSYIIEKLFFSRFFLIFNVVLFVIFSKNLHNTIIVNQTFIFITT